MRLIYRDHGPLVDVERVRYWTGLTGPLGRCHFVSGQKKECGRKATRFFLLCFSSESDDVHVARFCDRCTDVAFGREGDRTWLGSRIAYTLSEGELLAITVLMT